MIYIYPVKSLSTPSSWSWLCFITFLEYIFVWIRVRITQSVFLYCFPRLISFWHNTRYGSCLLWWEQNLKNIILRSTKKKNSETTRFVKYSVMSVSRYGFSENNKMYNGSNEQVTLFIDQFTWNCLRLYKLLFWLLRCCHVSQRNKGSYHIVFVWLYMSFFL